MNTIILLKIATLVVSFASVALVAAFFLAERVTRRRDEKAVRKMSKAERDRFVKYWNF